MDKLGILVLYINIGELDSADVPEYVQNVMNEIERKEEGCLETSPIDLWEKIYIPIREGDPRIQVIRNDDNSDIDEELLSELKEKLSIKI